MNLPNDAKDPPGGPGERIDLSVLIPVYNEVDNVGPLHAELDAVLRPGRWNYELIFVNDGSTDGTAARLGAIQRADPEHVRVAFLRRNCGQTAALSAALDLARGDILIPMDGDRQNDPADIPRLIDALDGGHDVVSGWRKDRHDAFLTRKIPSWVANRLVARLSGVPLHDFGCTMKAYRRSVLEGVRLYGEMHRFIPIFAAWQGARVTELVVNHRPRTAGKTKYGLGRTFNVVLDLILIRFLQRYSQRPLHFFGRFGLWSFGLCGASFLAMLYFKYVFPWPYLWWGPGAPAKSFVETPLPSLTVMFLLAGFVSILLGIQSELIMRTYYESQHKTTYLLGEVRQGRVKGAEKMAERRMLSFSSLDEVMPEVERLLAGHVMVGKWSLAQVLQHLAWSLHRTATLPAAAEPPTPEQEEARRRTFDAGRFPDGIVLPPTAMAPDATDPRAAAESLRAALAAFAARSAPFPAHPRLGPLDGEQWESFHRMHCAHHLGFAVPTT